MKRSASELGLSNPKKKTVEKKKKNRLGQGETSNFSWDEQNVVN